MKQGTHREKNSAFVTRRHRKKKSSMLPPKKPGWNLSQPWLLLGAWNAVDGGS